VLVPLAILIAVAGLLAYAARDVLTPAIGVHVVPVVAKPVAEEAQWQPENEAEKPAAGGAQVQAPGWIEPDPYAISIPALVEGVVKEVMVLEGETVHAGQVVATLIDDELRIAERSARASIAEREAEVARAEASLTTARARTGVEEAALESLRDEVERKRSLVPAGGLSEGEFRRMEIRLRGAEASVAEARSVELEADAILRQGRAAVETARVMLAEAALKLERTQVRSPAAGVVLARLVEPGTRISMSGRGDAGGMPGAVLRVYNPAKLQVRVDVPLGDAAKIGVGTPAQVTTEALPGRTFTGSVVRTVHEANIQRNTVQFKVAIETPSPELKPEMLCRVRFNADSLQAASGGPGQDSGLVLVLPAAAVVNRSDARGQVWLVQHAGGVRGSTAVLRDVELAGSDGDYVTVASGVRPGDRAVINPPAGLRAGSRVRILGEAAVSH
jgi:HlyD family secretion protein